MWQWGYLKKSAAYEGLIQIDTSEREKKNKLPHSEKNIARGGGGLFVLLNERQGQKSSVTRRNEISQPQETEKAGERAGPCFKGKGLTPRRKG